MFKYAINSLYLTLASISVDFVGCSSSVNLNAKFVINAPLLWHLIARKKHLTARLLLFIGKTFLCCANWEFNKESAVQVFFQNFSRLIDKSWAKIFESQAMEL
jgi:hypothetical protein